MIDRFLYWGDHRNQKSGEIKGSCQPSLDLGLVILGSPPDKTGILRKP